MYLCPINRELMLQLLPKGGMVAEIGVATGDFSNHILSVIQPDCLHLVDPWEHQKQDDYENDLNNVTSEDHESRYKNILNMFSSQIRDGRIIVHRAYSDVAARDFIPEYFDWVYLDAMHTHDAVYSDLVTYWNLIKKDGFILGHDYTDNPSAVQQGFGVIGGVNQFVQETGARFVALTMDSFPTYVLAKGDSESLDLFINKILYNLPNVVEIRDYPNCRKFTHNFFNIAGKPGNVFSF